MSESTHGCGSAATTERDQDHLRRNLPDGSAVAVVDVTSSYAVLGVMGPVSVSLRPLVDPDGLRIKA